MNAAAWEALERVLEQGNEPDDVLRSCVRLLAEEPEVDWAAIALVEGDELVVGPKSGRPSAKRRVRVPVSFQGDVVGELWVDGNVERAFLERVALAISPYVLVGWDTSGEAWKP